MLVKLGKEIKIPTNENFISKYGTINALNPQSIFISIHSWATPKHNLRFNKKLRVLSHNVKKRIHSEIDYQVFHDKYIVDFDMRESGLQKDKQSFMSVEITLFPKNIITFPNDIYNSTITKLVDNVVRDIKRDRNFNFTAKKEK